MISVLQLTEPKDINGLITENHLGYAHMTQPQASIDVVTMIHQARLGYTDLDTCLNKFPKIVLKTDADWYWDLMGGGEKNIPLIKASLTSGGAAISATDKAGVGVSRFYLTFPEAYFSKVDSIFGHKAEYQLRITDSPAQIGSNYEYCVELLTGDPNLYVPYDELQDGKRFSKYAPVVERTLSKEGAGVNYTTPFRMKNSFTMLRMEDTRPGNMVRRPMTVTIPVPGTSKKFTVWQDLADWTFDMQFMMAKNRAMYYSRINKTSTGNTLNKGASGFNLTQGAGLRQQIESSNVCYYPTDGFSIKWLTSVLVDLSENRLPEDQRLFVLKTGERGMIQFSEAVQDYSNFFVRVQDDTRIKDLGGNKRSFGGQFIEYNAPNGIRVRLEHDPFKDNDVDHKDLHPDGGVAESYVYDILDMGTVNGQANIRKVVCEGSEDIKGYINGLRSAFTPTGQNNQISTGIDGYQIHRAWIGGVQVTDPTRCAIIKPSILS